MESVELRAPARPRRLAITVEGAFVIAILCVLSTLVEALLSLENSFIRARLPWGNNSWSEGPLTLQLWRIAHGQPAYTSTLRVNSFDYGPLYLDMLHWVQVLFHHPVDIVWLRWVTMFMGALSIVPLAANAVIIARRAGVQASDHGANRMIIVASITAGFAVLAQGITFDVVHPDNISYVFMVTAFLLTNLIAARMLKERWLLALVAFSIAAVFSKQSSFVMLPLLVAGLWLARRISFGWAALSAGVYGGIMGLLFFLLPRDELAWIFLVPKSHGYDLNAPRILDLLKFLTYWDPFFSILLLLFPFAVVFLIRNEGFRALCIDGAILIAVLFTAFAGFLKALGVWNNLTIIGIAMVPYFAAVLGVLLSKRILNRVPVPILIPTVALLLAVPLSLITPRKQEAGPKEMAQMREVANVARELCRTKKLVYVTTFPELFFECPNAQYVLMTSWQELYTAYPRYYIGPTDMDKPPKGTFLVAQDAMELPPAWRSSYEFVRRLPTVRGWGANYFPVYYVVYHLKPVTGHPAPAPKAAGVRNTPVQGRSQAG